MSSNYFGLFLGSIVSNSEPNDMPCNYFGSIVSNIDTNDMSSNYYRHNSGHLYLILTQIKYFLIFLRLILGDFFLI